MIQKRNLQSSIMNFNSYKLNSLIASLIILPNSLFKETSLLNQYYYQ